MYSSNNINPIFSLVLVTLVILLSSCKERSEYGKASDYEKLGALQPFTISALSPTDNSTYNSPATTVTVTFSKIMGIGSITTNTNNTSCSGSFQLSSDNFTTCVKMSATPVASDNITTFTATPADNLSGGTTHKLRITTSAKDHSSTSLASAYTTNGFTTSPAGSGTIKGSVKLINGDPLSGVSVALSIYGTTGATVTTDSNGDFSQSSLGLGLYTLEYTETGYITATQLGTLATANETLVAATETMCLDSSSGGDISGIIKDAVTGDVIPDVSVSVREGSNTRTGNTISGKTDTTDSNGAYTLSSMDAGSYTIQVSLDDWVSSYFNVRSCSGRPNMNSNMSKKLAEGEMRIVVSWEGTEDFDSHLEIPCTLNMICSGSNADDKSHLWYGVNQGGVSTNDYHNYTDIVSSGDNVSLDQDSRKGVVATCPSDTKCGPETISISNSKLRSGISSTNTFYTFHVHAFSRKGTNSTHLADNGTVVQVFYDIDQVINFDVPNIAGDLWTVFYYNGDASKRDSSIPWTSSGFSTRNIMASEATPGSVDNH